MADIYQQMLAATSPLTVAGQFPPEQLAAALRAVVELHAPFIHPKDAPDQPPFCCSNCRIEDSWPCPTVQAIARELGVEVTP